MPLELVAEFTPLAHDRVCSLKRLWARSGGRWTKLKKMVLAHRGARCGICGTEGSPLDAHEVWEYVDAADAGLDPESISKIMSEWRGQLEKCGLHASALAHSRPLARALLDIQLLCKPCHGCKHSYNRRNMRHWCRVNKASPEEFHEHYREAGRKWRDAIVIAVHFSGFDELPDYKTYKEWQDAMQDEADALQEDDWVYAENEMNDSGFGFSGWINK